MIECAKIVRAHLKALYWKNRMQQAERYMRKNLEILAEAGTGKHETENGFFTVSENNTYDASVIRSLLSPSEQALCLEAKWSNARAKVLFPEVYLSAKVENGYKVSI